MEVARFRHVAARSQFLIAGRIMLAAQRCHKEYLRSAFFALLVIAQPVPAADSYVHVELGVLEQAQGAIVRGFNILGEAVGGSVGFGQGKRAFLVREGSAENIDALPGGDSSLAHAINEQSTVVGSSNTASSLRAFLWSRTSGIRELGTLPGDSSSEAFGINRHNEVVGYSSGPSGIQAVLWTRAGTFKGSVDCVRATTAALSRLMNPAM
jgi:probable HAF family extracellular repeat protein